mmetsp:Transcript_30304/g.73721  ORF Transcript_30304/g.73721 Transcript_30304/m.73721 type:complete len:84 (+) Transcript_30304:186-437(+)
MTRTSHLRCTASGNCRQTKIDNVATRQVLTLKELKPLFGEHLLKFGILTVCNLVSLQLLLHLPSYWYHLLEFRIDCERLLSRK